MKVVEDSGQIEVISPFGRVYLYTHEQAEVLVQQVHDVLSQKIRWDDPDYLSRMLFCNMIPKENWYGEKGYGIGTEQYVDVNLLISIDTTNNHIKIYSAKDKAFHYDSSFDDFITNFINSATL